MASGTRNFGSDFGIDPGPFLLDVDSADHLAPKRFVARIHVGEVQIGEDVRQGREESSTTPISLDFTGPWERITLSWKVFSLPQKT